MGSIPPDGAQDPVVSPGEVVSGKFRVERIIGIGGMGVVVEATHLQLDERVALKFLQRSAMAMPEVVSRFAQEARAAVRLKSAHVARVIDVGTREDGVPYIVMEHLQGSDLGRVLAERGALPVAEAVEYVVQACEAVSEAHARGIIHRDLKPENLFLVQHEDGWQAVKVLDFGISKAALTGSAADPILASHRTTTLLGSPYYMSPEQLRATHEVDARADVWSLGATLFELLAATTAFDDSKQFTELVAEILEQPHRRLLDYRKDVSPELQEVVDRCLAKDRGARYQSAAELAMALLPFAPRRARVPVERALSLARAAGTLGDKGAALPPSQYPPGERLSGAYTALPSSGRVSAASSRGPGAVSRGPVADTPQARALTEPAPPGALPSSPASEPPKKRGALYLLFAAGLVVVVLLLLGLVRREKDKPVDAAVPSASSVAVVVPSSAPSASASAVASAEPAPSEAPSAAADNHAPPRGGAIPPRGGHRNGPAPKGSTSSGTAPASTLDIRLER